MGFKNGRIAFNPPLREHSYLTGYDASVGYAMLEMEADYISAPYAEDSRDGGKDSVVWR